MAMALGIFAGTGMDVRAADELQFDEVTDKSNIEEAVYNAVNKSNWLSEEALFGYQEWIETNLLGNGDAYYCIRAKVDSGKYYFQCVVVHGEDCYYLENESNLQGNIIDEKLYALKSGSISLTSRDIDLKFRKIDDSFTGIKENDLRNMIKGSAPTDTHSVYQMMRQIKKSNYADQAYFIYAYNNGTFKYIYYNNNDNGEISHYSDPFDELAEYVEGGYSIYVWDDTLATQSSASNSAFSSTSSSTPHTHSYSWVTVQDVSSEQDGIEEYRCSCGDVQERCVIPRYMAIVKGLYGAVKDAPQNGTATFDTGSAFTMTDYVIRKLSERTDVTTVITFEYQNQAYKMTIPAGADFTGLLADEEYFYGYFFFANAVGAKIEAI